MASKSSDSCSNGSIAAQRDEIARQLVAAVVQCQDAPAVAGQQAEIQSELRFIEAIWDPFDQLVTWWYGLKPDQLDYGFSHAYQQCNAALRKPLEYGAAFAKETKNRALAKAVRQVHGAGQPTIDRFIRSGVQVIKQRERYEDRWVIENRHANEAEKAKLKPLTEQCNQVLKEGYPLLSKVRDRLWQLRAQAHARLALAQTRATEIEAWKKQQTDLQAAAHALAAVRRVPEAPEDEDDR